MLKLPTKNYQIELGLIEESSFEILLKKYVGKTKVIIVDENTNEHCLPRLISHFDDLSNAEVIVLPIGEETKQLEIAAGVWEALSEYNVSRYDLIINLGGGVITDFGGFVASCYKRGIDYVNIPTSLLAMVDASVGGKTGVNLGIYKNQIGLFSEPVAVFIDSTFIHSLPAKEVKNGFAEMLKHGILISEEEFDKVLFGLKDLKVTTDSLLTSINCKKEIVERDFYEYGDRKLLNLGHTVGHAIEGVFIKGDKFPHGICVAYGLMVEAMISFQMNILSPNSANKLIESIREYYPFPSFTDSQIDNICSLLLNDKKNKDGKILSCLIKDFGNCLYDQVITEVQVRNAIKAITDSSY